MIYCFQLVLSNSTYAATTWMARKFLFLKRILPVSLMDLFVMRAVGLAPYTKLHP
jgi:hypothetical protein